MPEKCWHIHISLETHVPMCIKIGGERDGQADRSCRVQGKAVPNSAAQQSNVIYSGEEQTTSEDEYLKKNPQILFLGKYP